MSDILSLADTLEPNAALFKGDLQKIAKIHVSFYKFYIKFASKCEALVLDKKSQDYLESCIDFLENKKLNKKGIQQSRSNCLKMLDSLNDLCVTLNCDKKMLAGMHKLIDQASVGTEGKGEGTLDLLKQLKNLLNAPGDANDNDDDANGNDGRVSPDSTGSSAPEEASSRSRGGVEPMVQYLLSDSGMDSYYHKYNKDVKNFALTSQMNQIMATASAKDLREHSYSGLDNLLAKMKINVPIWNYHVDRVDTIDSSNVMKNVEIFGGNKSVTDAVLYSCPDYLTVGPFDVYVRNKVYVYHCLVNNCNNCMTTSLEFLKLHVKFQHGDPDVDWNCTDCDLIKLHSSCQRSLDGALDHLAKHHSIKSTYTLAKERLLEINQKIVGEDLPNTCPQPKPETFSEDNTDLFHCPNPECGFSTNSMPVAFGHYASTLDAGSVVQCRYCSLISYSTYELCEHLVKNHGNAKYKCGYCPYRSVSKANCVYHQRDAHPNSPSRIVGFEPLPIAEHRYSCRAHNTIKPFVCNDSCNFGTMVERKFNQHILTHPGMMVTCHYCERFHTADMGDLRDHFIVHGVGEYHCMYCKEAFNFITKIQQHLHEEHPSQYPFIIICQDYDSRSLSLKGKYNKVQKLDLGDESIVVLPLDSDKGVHTANVNQQSEPILIEDVDHCKMQLKTFMKNKEEPEEMPYAPPLPHIEETLDLTMSEDPKERVDIKPRLRVRTVEELIKSAQAPVVPEPEEPAEPEVATFYAFAEPTAGPSGLQLGQGTTPMLTPAQIKQERAERAVDPEVSEIDIEHHVIPSVQIKKEVLETARPAGKSTPKPPPKSPKKMKRKHTINPAHVKNEAIESREMDVETPSPQPLVIDESREDEDAVAALISRHRSSVSDESGRTPARSNQDESGLGIGAASTAEGPSSTAVTGFSGVTQASGAPVDVTLAGSNFLNETVMGSGGNVSEVLASGQSMIAPILSASSIDNVPVDFDCPVPGSDDPDTKEFTVDSEGIMIPRPLYTDPTVVDTVIISDGEDDYEDVRPSPLSSPPTTPPVLVVNRPSPSSSAGKPDSRPSTPATPTMPRLKVLQVPTLLNAGPQPLSQTVLVVDPRTSATSIGRITKIQKPQVIQSAPVIDLKRYRCKLCSFASEDRRVTYNHLYAAHPVQFSKQIRSASMAPRDGQPAGIPPEDRIVRAVSCPYCPDIVYEGIKSFEKHHAQNHCDFTEVKCFLVYNPAVKQHLQELYACVFCGHFCRNEAAVWHHLYSIHPTRIATMRRPLYFTCKVAFKKMVCPLYNCLDEFLDPAEFKSHVNAHCEVIACKKCTYIADSVAEFQNFHMKIEPEDRLLHFYYTQSPEERANLLNVQRFSNPLYSLSDVFFKEKSIPPTTPAPAPRKTTARKSTGGAQYNK